MSDKVIEGYECKFVIQIPNNDPNRDDYYISKENIHYKDGTIEPHIRIIKNYERKFWVTKKAYRNHKSKKEWEDMDKLIEYKCKDSALQQNVARALNLTYLTNQSMRALSRSPYLYGTDIKMSAVIKRAYQDKYPNLNTPNSLCTFDIETGVNKSIMNEIIVITAAMSDKLVCVVNEHFISHVPDAINKIKDKINYYIKDHIEKRSIKVYIEVVKDELLAIKKTFEYIHKWMPDFLAIWNINYDLPKMLEVLEKNKVDPKDIFCDPSLPNKLRYFNYKEGPSVKVKANGDRQSLNPANRWHLARCASSFYFIDAMCVYRLARLGEPELPSYSLDNILNKELGIRKLSFTQADKYVGLQKHSFLQAYYPIEYIVYNIFDSLSMIELDDKTKDLAQAISIMSISSDYSDFNSQPRRIVNELHFQYLKRGKVIGTTSDNLKEDIDEKTLPLTDWIITLPPHLLVDNGVRMVKEQPEQHTTCRLYGADIDILSAYPTNQCVFNVSKSTTKREVIDMPGIRREVFTMQNINLLSGPVNAIDYCTTMFNFPTLRELDDSIPSELIDSVLSSNN